MLSARSRADLRCWEESGQGGEVAPCAWPGHRYCPGLALRPQPALPLCTGAARPQFTWPSSPLGNRNVNREEGKKSRMIHQRLLQPEVGEGDLSLPDPVAGTALLAKEIALVGFRFILLLFFLTLPYFIVFF